MEEKLYIKDLIAKNKIEPAFDHLHQYLENGVRQGTSTKFRTAFNSMIIFKGRFLSLKEEKRIGIISSENENLELNQLRNNFLNLVDDLPNSLFKSETTSNSRSDIEEALEKAESIRQNSNYDYDIFLTHSNADRSEVRAVYEQLRGYGLRVFVSSESLKKDIGNSYFEKIEEALTNSQSMLIFFTPNAATSEWVKLEYQTFFNEFYLKNRAERKMLILKGKRFDFSTVPILLRRIQIASSIVELTDFLLLNRYNANEKEELSNEQQETSRSTKNFFSNIKAYGNAITEHSVKEVSNEKEHKIFVWLQKFFDWYLFNASRKQLTWFYFFCIPLIVLFNLRNLPILSLLAVGSLIVAFVSLFPKRLRTHSKSLILASLLISLIISVLYLGLVVIVR